MEKVGGICQENPLLPQLTPREGDMLARQEEEKYFKNNIMTVPGEMPISANLWMRSLRKGRGPLETAATAHRGGTWLPSPTSSPGVRSL